MEPRMKVVQNDVLVRRPEVSHARGGGGQGGQKHLQNGLFRGLGNFVTLQSTLKGTEAASLEGLRPGIGLLMAMGRKKGRLGVGSGGWHFAT